MLRRIIIGLSILLIGIALLVLLESADRTTPNHKNILIKKTEQGCEARHTITGERANIYPYVSFASDFEVDDVRELFKEQTWRNTAMLSPKANSVQKYVQLHKDIMSGGDFLDNRIDVERDIIHSGDRSLRFFAVPPSAFMFTSKSLIEKNNLCFAKGDDLWFSGWYYLEKGIPSTLVDFETRRLKGGPGIRLFIRQDGYASMELKYGNKPQYNQTTVKLPMKQWVHIQIHLTLTDADTGVIEMWQDDELILSATGQTLPTADSIYNALQVGITATTEETILFLDDVAISDTRL